MGKGKVALMVVAALMLPVPAQATGRFGPDAGFTFAREQKRSIRVWQPKPWDLHLERAVRMWNNRAEWELFQIVTGRTRADVTFADPDVAAGYDAGFYTVCYVGEVFDVRGPYTSCVVWMSQHDRQSMMTKLAAHELGHVLGFADHVYAVQYRDQRFLHARVCDDEEHRRYSPYAGVMSYCNWERTMSGADTRALGGMGYLALPPGGIV